MLSGDARAFGVIWDRHSSRVMRHLMVMGAAAGDAEDLVATVFLELWRRRDDVRMVDGSVLPWLVVTAQNVLRNASRSRRRYRRFLESLPPAELIPDHAEAFAERESARSVELRSLIGRCGKVDAALLALTAVEGFSVGEAASVVGVTEDAAKMRLSRVRRRLRAALGGVPVVEGGS